MNKYLLSIKGDEIFEKTLNIFSETVVSEFTEQIKNGNAEKLYNLLENDAEDISGSIGILSDKYRGLDEDIRQKICTAFYEDSGTENIVDVFNREIILYIAKNSDKETYLKLMSDNFGMDSVSDFTKSRMEALRNYNNIKGYDNEIKKFEVLNNINNAKYTQLEEIYKDNEAVLTLNNCSEYSRYKNMNETKKRTANEKTVSALLANRAMEIDDFLTVFKRAVSEAESTGGSTSGGGTSSGGSSNPGGKGSTSGSSGFTMPNTEEIAKPDKFNDVSKTFWAYDSIEKLAEKKIINGYQDGSFKPSDNITREGFVTILVNAFGLLKETSQCSFDDVNKENWFYSFVASGYENGIIGGLSENEFGTGLNITRQDVAVMIFRALRIDNANAGEAAKFADDISISDYAKEAVYYLKVKGVITGREDGNFDPLGNCTRAECAVMLCRVLDLV